MNEFRVMRTCSGARAGELSTPHGTVSTPVFLPVGSQGTVKTLTPDEIGNIGIRMVLANTYHIYLRPGIEVIGKVGEVNADDLTAGFPAHNGRSTGWLRVTPPCVRWAVAGVKFL